MKRGVLAGWMIVVTTGTPGLDARAAEGKASGDGAIQGKVISPWIRQNEAVVYLVDAPRKAEPPAQRPVLDQKDMLFLPHVLPVVVNSTVAFPNHDTVQHNIYSPSPTAKAFNLGMYPPGETKHVTFDRVGVVPLLCNVHSEMAAFVIVLPHPFFAVTDKQGRFAIDHVPPGSYRLAFWHEKLRPQTLSVVVTTGETAQVTFENLQKVPFYSLDLATPKSP
jgi:plastocyanin